MKTASASNTFGYYANRFGPQSAIVGVAAAVAAHLTAEHRRKAEEQSVFGKGDDDPGMIRIKLPPKIAAANPALAGVIDSVNGFREKLGGLLPGGGPEEDFLWKAPAVLASIGGIGYGAYSLADHLLKGLEKKRLKKDLSSAKDNYMDLVYRDLESPAGKTASALPVLDGLAEAVVDRLTEVNDYSKQAFWDGAANFTSGAVAAGILSAIYSFRNARKSESDVDEYLRQKARKAPIDTRIVIDSAEPQKVAVMALPTPASATSVFSPTSAAEKKLNKAKGIAEPPTATAPAAPKVANLYAIGMTGAQVSGLSQKEQEYEDTKNREDIEKERLENQQMQQRSEDHPISTVDGNTVIINTAQGPVTIDAMDPRAVKFLQSRPDLLRDIVNSPSTQS